MKKQGRAFGAALLYCCFYSYRHTGAVTYSQDLFFTVFIPLNKQKSRLYVHMYK